MQLRTQTMCWPSNQNGAFATFGNEDVTGLVRGVRARAFVARITQ
jgi:hypothetical protein